MNRNEQHDLANVKRAMIKEVLSRELGDRGFIHDLRQERMAMLLKFSTESHTDCIQASNEWISHIHSQLYKHSDMNVVFGVGGIYDQLLDVYRSFKEASRAIESADYSRVKYIIRYEDIPKGVGSYYYPMEIEQRIMNLVKSGNEQEVSKQLAHIYSEAAAGRVTYSEGMKPLLYDISATVYKIHQDVSLQHERDKMTDYDEYIEQLNSFITFEEAFGYISRTLIDICESVNKAKKSHNTDLKDNIIAYIHENYMDGGLCLASVADRYDINEVYLSQFFKEQTGENFSNYIEKTRMKHARELLREDQLTVEEIARAVGYMNTNTFYKAFKRIEGVSPRAFKNK